MKAMILTFGIAVAAVASVPGQEKGATDASAGSPQATATADLVDAHGKGVGRVRLRQAPRGLLLELTLESATPGVHGIHIHEVGKCERPSFSSAGGHFNPAVSQHGFLNPKGAHAGDLPNINVPANGQLRLEYFMADLTLEPGPRSLRDQNGSAIVLHAGGDDYSTDPSGGAGDRLACGTIQ